jgi:hypothetical protein
MAGSGWVLQAPNVTSYLLSIRLAGREGGREERGLFYDAAPAVFPVMVAVGICSVGQQIGVREERERRRRDIRRRRP